MTGRSAGNLHANIPSLLITQLPGNFSPANDTSPGHWHVAAQGSLDFRRAIHAWSSTALAALKKHYHSQFFCSLMKDVLPFCIAGGCYCACFKIYRGYLAVAVYMYTFTTQLFYKSKCQIFQNVRELHLLKQPSWSIWTAKMPRAPPTCALRLDLTRGYMWGPSTPPVVELGYQLVLEF